MRIALLTIDNRHHFRHYDRPKPYFGTAPAALLQGFAALPEHEVHVVSCTKRPMQSPAKLADNIWFHSLVVPSLGWLATGYQGCIRATRKKLRELNPDIVHGQGTEKDCCLNAVFSGFPNVLTIHGNMRLIAQVNHSRPFSYQWLAARLEAFTLPRTDGVVCISTYTQANVSSLVAHTWVVPNATENAFFEIKNHPASPPLIICVGVICPRKNQNDLIRALAPLAELQPFQLLFLGQTETGTPYEQEFQTLVKRHPWCKHPGSVDRQKLIQYLGQASLLVLPCIEDNCPMVVLEAQAAGVPVVASRVGGVPDLVEDRVTGLLCDPAHPTTFRDAVESVLAQPQFARELVRRARLKATQQYHPTAVARQHVHIYKEVLGKHGS